MTSGAQMDRKLYEILVPTVKSIDPPKYFRKRFHKTFDARVREISGGLTILKPVKGEWISKAGELFEERMIPVRIACTPEQIEQIADIVHEMYAQEISKLVDRKAKLYEIKQFLKMISNQTDTLLTSDCLSDSDNYLIDRALKHLEEINDDFGLLDGWGDF